MSWGGTKIVLYSVYFVHAHPLLLEVTFRPLQFRQGQYFKNLRLFVGESLDNIYQFHGDFQKTNES